MASKTKQQWTAINRLACHRFIKAISPRRRVFSRQIPKLLEKHLWREENPVRLLLKDSKDKGYKVATAYSRYSVQGATRRRARLLSRLHTDNAVSGRLVTLTFAEQVDEQRKYDLWTFAPTAVSRLLNIMRQWVRRNDPRIRLSASQQSQGFQYAVALEAHKTGFPHVHIVIPGLEWLDYSALREVWSLGNVNVTEKIIADGVAYVAKYVAKLSSCPPELACVLRKLRTRMAWFSNNWPKPERKTEQKVWELVLRTRNTQALRVLDDAITLARKRLCDKEMHIACIREYLKETEQDRRLGKLDHGLLCSVYKDCVSTLDFYAWDAGEIRKDTENEN